ncbi:MAG: DUF4170 domain-containing protein [Rhodospirillales bacterium]|jgi:hypothetical protein
MGEVLVVGGEFADARFAAAAPGRTMERFAPFPSYEDARRIWEARTMATTCTALVRYRLVEPGPCAA